MTLPNLQFTLRTAMTTTTKTTTPKAKATSLDLVELGARLATPKADLLAAHG
jgi:hypothetical protein